MQNHFLSLLALSALVITSPHVSAECFRFTQEHVDLLSFQWNAASGTLRLMASDDTHGVLFSSDQCVVVCPESMKFTLPAGSPLGNEGDSLWILPQSPYADVPYVGVSAETISAGDFNDPLTIQLKRVEGPGQVMVWQSTTFGNFDVKMDSRNGIGTDDKLTPLVGGHEHYNWGFTTSGVYRIYFQASGVRVGETTNTYSPETPFTFHILPLKPFEVWQGTNWPCESDSSIIGPVADPDGDGAANAIEYALGTDAKEATTNGWPVASLVSTNGQKYGAFTYTHAKAASDCVCEVEVANDIPTTNWQVLNNVFAVVDNGGTETITICDSTPVSATRQRFYRLRVTLR